MKKRNLIAGIASLLCLGAIATSIALYVDAPKDVQITVGGSITTDGALTLTLVNNSNHQTEGASIFESVRNTEDNKVTADNLTSTINPYNKVHATYKLGMEKNAGYTENVVYSKITITIDTTFDFNDLNISASILGYDDITWTDKDVQKTSYYASKTGKPKFTGATNEDGKYVLTANVPYSLNDSIYKTQYLDLQISYNGAAEDYVLKGAEKTLKYTVNLSYPPSSDVTFPYLLGSFNSWTEYDNYVLVPNLKSAEDEWMITHVSLPAGAEMKVKRGDTWSNSEWEGQNTPSDLNYRIENAGFVSAYYKAGPNSTWFSYSAS